MTQHTSKKLPRSPEACSLFILSLLACPAWLPFAATFQVFIPHVCVVLASSGNRRALGVPRRGSLSPSFSTGRLDKVMSPLFGGSHPGQCGVPAWLLGQRARTGNTWCFQVLSFLTVINEIAGSSRWKPKLWGWEGSPPGRPSRTQAHGCWPGLQGHGEGSGWESRRLSVRPACPPRESLLSSLQPGRGSRLPTRRSSAELHAHAREPDPAWGTRAAAVGPV